MNWRQDILRANRQKRLFAWKMLCSWDRVNTFSGYSSKRFTISDFAIDIRDLAINHLANLKLFVIAICCLVSKKKHLDIATTLRSIPGYSGCIYTNLSTLDKQQLFRVCIAPSPLSFFFKFHVLLTASKENGHFIVCLVYCSIYTTVHDFTGLGKLG